MDSASAGDTVWVAPGAYGTLRVPGGVRLVAESGPAETVFAARDPAVLAVGGADTAAVLEGLAVDGLGAAEGGVVAEGTKVVLRDCEVRGCWSGVRVIRGDAVLVRTTVRTCRNGIYLFETGGSVTDCDVAECAQGITLVSASPRVRGSVIHDNVTGVVVSEFSSPSLGGNARGANRIVDNRGAAVRNEARARQTGLRAVKPLSLDASYNYWGTDCPDSLLFLGPVTFSPWMDAKGNARTTCSGSGGG